MNIFNYLSSILFTKKHITNGDLDQQSDYQPFLINRWCSMLDKHTCTLLNVTANTLYSVLEDKYRHWQFLHYLIPRSRFKRINYIKKDKHSDKSKDIILKLSRKLELSTREINVYVKQLKLDLSKYEHTTKSKH